MNVNSNSGILILLLFFGIYSAQAQVSFHPGLRAGANFSHFTEGDYNYYNDSMVRDDNYSSTADFYIGFFGALKLSKYYTLQPEINYSAQGSDYRSAAGNKTFKVDYLCFQAINKFTFSDKFNVHLGPTLEFVVDKNFDVDADVDLAFVLGAGINLTPNFAIEARVKKGIVPVIDYNDNHTNVVFSVGGTYTFDLK